MYVTNGQGDHHHQFHVPEHSGSNLKRYNQRPGRDKRREEKRKALEAHAAQAVDTANDLSRLDTLVPASSPTHNTTTTSIKHMYQTWKEYG
jgi:hypothetical protein